ncbi:MAG: hypothetical protein PVF58_03930 [Candidatus Methanofastidiosia archaeon]|jgi:hypothetical protein
MYNRFIFDDLRYRENLQHEFIGLTKVFEAVDALAYCFLKNTLGKDWIVNKRFVPVTVFREEGDYYINIDSYVINVPYHDCFRSRYWAFLSHEVAHMFVHYYHLEIRDQEFNDLLTRNFYKLSQILQVPTDEPALISQVVELICDIIACFVCGPPPLFSLCTYDILSLSRVYMRKSQCIDIVFRTHPLLFFRIAAMKKTLEHTGIMNVDNDLSEFISSTERLLYFDTKFTFYILMKNKCYQIPRNFLKKYSKFVQELTSDVLIFLDWKTHEIKPYGKNKYMDTIKMLKSMELEHMTPIDAMNMVWLKRRAKTFDASHISTEEFFQDRKNETKIFETMTRQCYKYYDEIVVLETKDYTMEVSS